MEATLLAHTGAKKMQYEELALVPTPQGTDTHKPVPHHEVVNALVETLGFRHIGVHKQEYAVSHDGMKMFGIMELETTFNGCRFALALRNSHDKSMRLALTVGYRVFCCDNMAFNGDFEPVLAKHSKHFNILNALSVGVDQMQRNFEPMVQAVDRWRGTQLSDVSAKLLIYPGIHRSRARNPAPPCPAGARFVLQPATRGIPTPFYVELEQRLHRRVQRT